MDELVAVTVTGRGIGVQPVPAPLSVLTEHVQMKLPALFVQSDGATHESVPALHSSMSTQVFGCPLQLPSAVQVTVATPLALGAKPVLQLGVQL